jgi:hypothetical protein
MSESVWDGKYWKCSTCFGARGDGVNCSTCRNARYDDTNTIWHLNLSKYHRDNLVLLLELIGYPWDKNPGVPPFHIMNTGDWVGELWLDLQYPKGKEKPEQANTSVARVKQEIEHWLKYREQK